MFKRAYHIMYAGILLVSSLGAQVVPHLYQVEVPVVSQATDLRETAINQGFQQVLIRVSGNSQVLKNKNIVEALSQADNYVEQYSYVNLPLGAVVQGDNPQATQLNLQLMFDQVQIRALLQQAGQPNWGVDRPSILVWLALNDGQVQSLLSTNTVNPWVETLQQIAVRRGIPLVWPNLASINQQASSISPIESSTAPTQSALAKSNLNPTDVFQTNIKPLSDWSANSGADAMLLVALTQSGDELTAQWTLLINQEQLSWQTSGQDKMVVLQTGMDNVVDAIAERYANQASAQTLTATLAVNHLTSIEDYARVQHYFQTLTPIKSVELLQLDASAAQFKLVYEGSETNLVKAISLDRKFVSVDPNQSDFPSNLNYRWQ